jgi:hypothetical protein
MRIMNATPVKIGDAQCNVSCAIASAQVPTTCMVWGNKNCIFAGQFWLSGLPCVASMIDASSQEHPCPALCTAAGICDIETAPHSIEATFTGRHENFQYTKVPTSQICMLVS